jgi:hypothetical protein
MTFLYELEEKLSNLEKKELIYLFLSIPIAVFTIYFNFSYQSFIEHEKKLNKEIKKKEKKLDNLNIEVRNLKKSKKDISSLKKELEQLREDYKFIKYSFYAIDIINLTDVKSYQFLENLLKVANQLNLDVSFGIDWSQKTPPFTRTLIITIEGIGDYLSILNYIEYIENTKTLNRVDNIFITRNDLKKDIDLIIKQEKKKQKKAKKNKKDKKDKNKNYTDIVISFLGKSFVENKKNEDSTLSFTLSKYSEKDITELKYLAKSRDLNLYIEVNEHNSNDLDVSFSGDVGVIKGLLQYFNLKKKKKLINYYNLKVKLKYGNKASSSGKKKQSEYFKIKIKLVGAQ